MALLSLLPLLAGVIWSAVRDGVSLPVVSLMLGPLSAAISVLLTGATAPPGPTGDQEDTSAPEPGVTGPTVDTLKLRAEAFARFRDPASGKPDAIGAYSNGCLVGGVALPRSGPGFEVIRLGRNRRYGHPALVAYIKRLAASAQKKVGTLLVGDLAQPRGGPTPTGHRSHQSGLDVDIALTRPAWLATRRIKPAEREQLPMVPVVDLATRTFTAEWSPKIEKLIELAASDPEVDRVFVHPRIKRELCDRAATAALAVVSRKIGRGKVAQPDPGWLRNVRPWWGHHDHLHVRLKCPADSSGCESQPPLPPGDGCGEIAWWESEEARRAREPRRDPGVPVEPRPVAPLPVSCQTLLDQGRPAPLPATAQRPR